MKEIINGLEFKDFKNKISREKKYFLNFKSNHIYYTRHKMMFDNEINNYINYLNFKEILKFFQSTKNINLLDLGCGIGDKSVLLKSFYPSWNIYGFETTNYDDPDHNETKPYLFYKKIYTKINKDFKINLKLYDGIKLNLRDNFFDIMILYAVIEHINPNKRKKFIKIISKKLKNKGYIILTRCPRYYGLMEFITRKFNIGHEWVLKKEDLLNIFNKSEFKIELLKIMNNIPNNYNISKSFSSPLIIIDKVLQKIKWPFATDYFLIIKKI